MTTEQCATSNGRKRRSLSLPLGPCVVLIVAGLLACVAFNAFAQHISEEYADESSAVLTVVQDESSMEAQIAVFLEDRMGEPELNHYGDDDIELLYAHETDDTPLVVFQIDTYPMWVEDDVIQERAIGISFYHILPDDAKNPETLTKAVLFNNEYMNEMVEPYPGRIVIDGDGDLVFATLVNIPGPSITLHAEVVFDIIYRMREVWEDFWPKFEEEVLD